MAYNFYRSIALTLQMCLSTNPDRSAAHSASGIISLTMTAFCA